MVTNIETLKSSSIVSVIERYIPLRKNGTNFIACCPFHSEKSPSFVVSEVKGMYKCFGCGKGGDVISFIKEYEKIDFNEALQRLSELTNIALEYDKAQKVGKSPSEVLEKINTLAKAELQKRPEIIEYLAARGITQELCERYDIGLVPSKETLLAHFSAGELIESGFANNYGSPRGASTARDDKPQPSLRGSEATEAKQGEAEASLVIHRQKVDSSMDRHADKSARDDRESNNSNHAQNLNTPQDSRICDEKVGLCSGEQGDKTRASIDEASHKLPTLSRKAESTNPKANAQNIAIPMHHRISIAIRNPQHKIVAFVARTHPHYNFNKNAPKYINSKESYFYKKAQILYLYSNAKATIQAQKEAFVVEGYIDSILLHENGYKHALATGGTAFNIQHLNLLTRLDCEVIFCFDNDKSGMAANFRAVKVCFEAGFYRVRVAILRNRDERGRLCKDINEALLAMDRHAACAARDDREKLEFNFLSGYEFFIKWLYKNKDKTSAFNEIKAAIAACKNFYDKQAFLECACKLTGVPSEYFTQDRLPTKQANDDYSNLIASILHSEECAYIASELDLSFLPKELEKSVRIFLASQKADSSMDRHATAGAVSRDDKVGGAAHDDRETLSLRGSEATEAIHKKANSIVKNGSPRGASTARDDNLKEFIQTQPLESEAFYQHYCDLYLAHLHREQTKARAKKDLHLVLALSEKIAQVKQDIHAQKAF